METNYLALVAYMMASGQCSPPTAVGDTFHISGPGTLDDWHKAFRYSEQKKYNVCLMEAQALRRAAMQKTL
jgi:hypothetical protein